MPSPDENLSNWQLSLHFQCSVQLKHYIKNEYIRENNVIRCLALWKTAILEKEQMKCVYEEKYALKLI